MCVVSMMYDYAKTVPDDRWTQPGVTEFIRTIEQAQRFDEANGEPDCEDPEKAKILKKLKKINKRLKRLEKAGVSPDRTSRKSD